MKALRRKALVTRVRFGSFRFRFRASEGTPPKGIGDLDHDNDPVFDARQASEGTPPKGIGDGRARRGDLRGLVLRPVKALRRKALVT